MNPLQNDFVKTIGGALTGFVGSLGLGLAKGIPAAIIGGKAPTAVAGAADLGLGAYSLYKGFFEAPPTTDEFWLWFYRSFGIFETLHGAISLACAAAMGTPQFESFKTQALRTFKQYGFDLEATLADVRSKFEALITSAKPTPSAPPTKLAVFG